MSNFNRAFYYFKILLTYSIILFACANCSAKFDVNSAEVNNIPPSDNTTNEAPPSDDDQNPPPPPEKISCEVPATEIVHSPGFVAQKASRVYLDGSKYPEAKCNDGTQAVYIIRPGFGEAKNRWIVWLDGGGSCTNAEDCTIRYNDTPFYLTSKPAPLKTWDMSDGVQSADPSHNEDFYDATFVKVHYCSSDGWTGNKNPDPNKPGVIPDSWYFKGHAIVRDVFEDLKTKGLLDAKEVLFMGSSAGAMGVFMNANSVAKQLPSSIRFVLSTDAGFHVETRGFDPNQADGFSLVDETPNSIRDREGFSLWQAIGDIVCSTLSNVAEDIMACNSSSQLAKPEGTLKIPMFVRQSLNDGVALKGAGLDIQENNPPTQEALFRSYFADRMRTEMNASDTFYSIYAPLNTKHGVVDTDIFYKEQLTFGSTTTSIMKSMGQWYRSPCAHNLQIQ